MALGNFDGVHLGHQAVLSAAVEAAKRLSGDAVAFTFEPHPAKVLAPGQAPPMITNRDRKLELIGEAGVEVCVVEPFTRELAELSPSAFVEQILVSILGAHHVTVGYDFSFGKARAGTVDLLRELGAERGFDVQVLEPVTVDGVVASSTRIRSCVTEGDMAGARRLLGRDFDVDGVVVRGAQRGRDIGVPTANIATETELLPAPGIYAGRVELLGQSEWLDAAISRGTNPTFVDSDELSLEAHILDFDRDIYGRRVRVSFAQMLRGERRFDGVDALVAQIQIDIARTREILRHGK